VSDWDRRPLTARQLHYAALDAVQLPLYDALLERRAAATGDLPCLCLDWRAAMREPRAGSTATACTPSAVRRKRRDDEYGSGGNGGDDGDGGRGGRAGSSHEHAAGLGRGCHSTEEATNTRNGSGGHSRPSDCDQGALDGCKALPFVATSFSTTVFLAQYLEWLATWCCVKAVRALSKCVGNGLAHYAGSSARTLPCPAGASTVRSPVLARASLDSSYLKGRCGQDSRVLCSVVRHSNSGNIFAPDHRPGTQSWQSGCSLVWGACFERRPVLTTLTFACVARAHHRRVPDILIVSVSILCQLADHTNWLGCMRKDPVCVSFAALSLQSVDTVAMTIGQASLPASHARSPQHLTKHVDCVPSLANAAWW
jgi:hypothetical protein